MAVYCLPLPIFKMDCFAAARNDYPVTARRLRRGSLLLATTAFKMDCFGLCPRNDINPNEIASLSLAMTILSLRGVKRRGSPLLATANF